MEYIAEAIGTFIFVSVILISVDKFPSIAPFAIAITLLAVIFFTSNASSSSINPAVTLALWFKGESNNGLSTSKAIYYVVAELIGAGIAVLWFRMNLPAGRTALAVA